MKHILKHLITVALPLVVGVSVAVILPVLAKTEAFQATNSQDFPLMLATALFCGVGMYWLVKSEIAERKRRAD